MKAEEILQQAYSLILEKQSSDHAVVDPILIDTLKEYANIQINLDRQRIKDFFENGQEIDLVPIILE